MEGGRDEVVVVDTICSSFAWECGCSFDLGLAFAFAFLFFFFIS